MSNDFFGIKAALQGMASNQVAKLAPEIRREVEPIVNAFLESLACNYEILQDTFMLQQILNGALPRRNESGEFPTRYYPRALATPPRYYQPPEEQRDGVSANATLDVETDLGRCSVSGYIANLSDEFEFDYEITAADGTSTGKVALPPRANEPLSCFVSKIVIYPLGSDKARYKVRVD